MARRRRRIGSQDVQPLSLLEVLPLAIVMVAGPQILTPISLATSDTWRANSAAYIFGASLSISLVVVIAYLLGSSLGGGGGLLGPETDPSLSRRPRAPHLRGAGDLPERDVSEPPEWMGKLTSASPRFSFRLGFLLLGVFPTDIVTWISVGTYLAANGDPVTDAAGFVLLTPFILSLPSLGVVVLGTRAEAALPKIRDWMNDNSWVISELVIALFIVLTLDNLVG